MAEQIDTVVIGGGQAGLSMSYCLTLQNREHVVLERYRIGETWRIGRWDSFTLVTPNWMIKLPGAPYQGSEPDGFMPRQAIVDYLEAYAASFNAPVETGVRVTSVEQQPDGEGYIVNTNRGNWEARNVVVATGLFQEPKVPEYSENVPAYILQLHSGQYRNPEQLPDGAVLVVGSAQSGAQIAEELYQSGRKVYLVVGSAGRVPRRYRGKDSSWWLVRSGLFDRTPEQLSSPAERFAGNPHLSGKNGGHTLNLHKFAQDGVTLLGRLQDIVDGKLILAPDLNQNLAKADAFSANVIKGIDEAVQKMGLNVPEDDAVREEELASWHPLEEVPEVDLDDADITGIVWAIGYKFDFSWVRLPVFDEYGFPVQKRGATDYKGLYFLGMPWLSSPKSGLLLGVGDDAEYIANHMMVTDEGEATSPSLSL